MTLKQASIHSGIALVTLKRWAREGYLPCELKNDGIGRPYYWVTGPVPPKRKTGGDRRSQKT